RSPDYFYDADAIREPANPDSFRTSKNGPRGEHKASAVRHIEANHRTAGERVETNPAGRNKRSVWTIPSQPYPGAHFATMPEALVRPCILAALPSAAFARRAAALGSGWRSGV